MWYTSVDWAVKHFVESLDRSLSYSSLDAILKLLKTQGLTSKEAVLHIFRAYVAKIQQLSCTPPRYRCHTNFGRMQLRNPWADPSFHQSPCRCMSRCSRTPYTLSSGQPMKASPSRKVGVPPTPRCSNSASTTPKQLPATKNADYLHTGQKVAFEPIDGTFANSVVKQLRRDVATQLQKGNRFNSLTEPPSEPRNDTQLLPVNTIFNPKQRLAGGAEMFASPTDKSRMQQLLEKMGEIEVKINDFKERAISASRLKVEVQRLQAALDNEREMYATKLSSIEVEFRKQLSTLECQAEICRKERTIYEKLARKLEGEVRKSEKDIEKYQRRAEELERQLNSIGHSSLMGESLTFAPENKKVSMESIGNELQETRRVLRTIEDKHDKLLMKLDQAINSGAGSRFGAM